jgi:hypothetical protein
MKLLFITILAITTLAVSCRQKSEHAKSKAVAVNNSKLIAINFADTNYYDVANYARDTVTTDGWAINYFVKNDSTRYNDIYIKWWKGNTSGLFKFEDVLLMRTYFIPVFVGENKTYLFLEHACATECRGLLTLSKDSITVQRDFVSVLKYDIKTGRVVFMPDRSRSSKSMEVAVFDLAGKTENRVIFKKICNLSPARSCVDSVFFGKNYVKLFAGFEGENGKITKETQQIKFDH